MKNPIKYSKIIAGTMTWGSWGKAFDTKKSIATMHHCLELGITTFDHADIYGDYTTEADFGKAFAESEIKRQDVQLISKCGIQMVTGRPNKVAHYQYNKDYIIGSAEASLKNLETDYLDMLLLHRPSPLMQPDEIAEAIEKLQKEGKVIEFGVSNFTPSQIAMIETKIPVSGNQVEFSLTMNKPMYDGTLDDGIAHRRMMMAWSPLGSYFRENDKKQGRIKKVLKTLEEKYSASANALLLAWLLKHPAKIYPVIGTTNTDRLTDSAKSVNINLEREDWFALLEASQGHPVP
ncbi:aldo/keto reductase [Costertonia aggregata]|uniref:Aldo/keto reductase n=1 Tax=Costertonia aggregata TaxID=343403 RepID=A0A7H9APZ8_9FLAO|nr:aldo/keto reductase [Costertonia aggregata]QLG45510.1 aldo/keto reductase [Costertonia aggregata]